MTEYEKHKWDNVLFVISIRPDTTGTAIPLERIIYDLPGQMYVFGEPNPKPVQFTFDFNPEKSGNDTKDNQND